MSPGFTLRSAARNVFLGAALVVLLCIPWVLAGSAFGWSERPAHLLQSFLAIPVAFLSSGWFLGMRTPEGSPDWERRLAWVVCVLSGLWLAFMAWVLMVLARGMFPGEL